MRASSIGDPDHFRMRSPARGLVKAALVHAQAAAWVIRGATEHPGLRILYYHRIGPGNDQLTVSTARFRRHLDQVARTRYPVVDLAAVNEKTLGQDATALAITLDDGYGELLEHAFPELEARGWPATVYVCPGAVAGEIRFPWSQRHHPILSWDAMRTVESRGLIRFEPHSLTHAHLPSLDRSAAEREIRGSKDALEMALGRPARSFCYPGGFFGAREIELVSEAGFQTAVSSEYGVNRAPWDRFALRRIPVDRYDTTALFAARLRGATDRPPPGRRRRQLPAHRG